MGNLGIWGGSQWDHGDQGIVNAGRGVGHPGKKAVRQDDMAQSYAFPGKNWVEVWCSGH